MKTTQPDGKIYTVLGLEELIFLKWPSYSIQSTDSMQFLSKYQWHFSQKQKNNFKICMEMQNTPNSQNNLEKEEQSWRNHTSWLQTILQSYSNQNSMVLEQKHTHRSMQQNREPRNKPTHLWSINLTKETRLYIGEKTVSSISCAEKTGHLHVKE